MTFDALDLKKEIQDITQWLKANEYARKAALNLSEDYSDRDKKKSSVVLRTDTRLELGGPENGSYSMILWTENEFCVDEIIIVGEDIPDASDTALPLAMIIMVSGMPRTEEELYYAFQYTVPPGLFDGIMIKHTHDSVWFRMSYEAANSNMNYLKLGSEIRADFIAENSWAKHVSIVFVTTSRQDLEYLKNEYVHVNEVRKELRKSVWEKRGVDITTCQPGGHCGACEDKSVCDEVRKMDAAYRKGVSHD